MVSEAEQFHQPVAAVTQALLEERVCFRNQRSIAQGQGELAVGVGHEGGLVVPEQGESALNPLLHWILCSLG